MHARLPCHQQRQQRTGLVAANGGVWATADNVSTAQRQQGAGEGGTAVARQRPEMGVWKAGEQRRSFCERIEEEDGAGHGTLAPGPAARFGADVFKRHHPHRSRSSSAPHLILSSISSPPLHILPADHSPSSTHFIMSLMPRSDSFSVRTRGASHIDFKTATTGVVAKAMRNELSHLVSTVQDPQAKKACPPSLCPSSISLHLFFRSGIRHRDAVLLLPLHSVPF